MNLNQLRAFYFVGKYGSLPKAANHLKVTPPAISVQLKKLEADLSVKIFDRRPNKLVLTDKGLVLFNEVKHVFAALTRMQEAIVEEPNTFSGRITIALGQDLAKFFAPQIAAFSREHPRVRITIHSKTSMEAIGLLLEGGADIGITSLLKVPRGIQKKKLVDNQLYLVFQNTHPLARKRKITLADVGAYPMMMHASGTTTRQVIDAGFAANGVEMETILEVGLCQSILDFVRLGLGIGLVHGICLPAAKEKNLNWYQMTREFQPLEVYVVYKKDSVLKPSHQAFIEALVSSPVSTSGKRITAKKPI